MKWIDDGQISLMCTLILIGLLANIGALMVGLSVFSRMEVAR